jgi:lipopolysaccharide export LptBFGC system permease protein LptF
VRQLLAVRGVHDGEAWVFHDGRLRDPDPDTRTPLEAFDTLRVEELTEAPDLIRSEYKVSQLGSLRGARKVQLTVAEILEYRRLHPGLEGRQRALLETQLQVRLATPWTSLVVVLIAVPFGAGSGRRNAFVGVASSIFIGFGFFVVQQLGVGLGAGGHLPPVLAAWLPNGLFGLGGLWLTSRVR